MALGDGIRRNIAHVDPTERAMLRDAILALHHRYYPGSPSDVPPGGVSWWFKQDEIHQATHVHGGPEFLPWHREITNRFEALIRQINPRCPSFRGFQGRPPQNSEREHRRGKHRHGQSF